MVYSHNDEMTLGALAEIEQAGYRPGKDIVIISIDGGQEAIDKVSAQEYDLILMDHRRSQRFQEH